MNFYIFNTEGELASSLSSNQVGTHTPILEARVEEKLSTYDQLFLSFTGDSPEFEEIDEEFTVVFKDTKGWREYLISYIDDVDSSTLTRTLEADLSSVELQDDIVEHNIQSDTDQSRNPERLLESILKGTRWEVGEVDSAIYSRAFNQELEYSSVSDALDTLSSAFNAEVQFSYQVDGKKIVRRFVNLYAQFGRDEGKVFELEKDVSEVRRVIETDGIKTTIIPIGKEPQEVTETDEETGEETTYTPDRITIEDVEWSVENGDPVNKPLGDNYITHPEALEEFGRPDGAGGKRPRKLVQEIDVETDSELISLGWVQLGRYVTPKVTYEATVQDIYILSGENPEFKHEHVFLGDTVAIRDFNFKSPLIIQNRITEMERDLLAPINNKITLGNGISKFSNNETREELSDTEERLQGEIDDVRQNLTTVQRSVGDNETNIYRGSTNPTGMNENDLWFRPHPTKPNEKQMLLYDGVSWEIQADTAKLADADRLQFGTLDGALLNVINLNADSITAGNLDVEKISITVGDFPILYMDQDGEIVIQGSRISTRVYNDLDKAIEDRATKEELEEVENQVAYSVDILSSNGTVFKNGDIETTLIAHVRKGLEILTYDLPDSSYNWTKVKNNGEDDEAWNEAHKGVGSMINITHEDVKGRATFQVEVYLPTENTKVSST